MLEENANREQSQLTELSQQSLDPIISFEHALLYSGACLVEIRRVVGLFRERPSQDGCPYPFKLTIPARPPDLTAQKTKTR